MGITAKLVRAAGHLKIFLSNSVRQAKGQNWLDLAAV